jgi:G3E family GTPase
VLTKTDLADPAAVLARIRALNPSAPLWRAAEDPPPADALLAGDLFDLAGKSEAARQWFAAELANVPPHHQHRHDPNRHGETIRAFSLVFDAPLDWTMFGIWLTMLLHRHGAAILRVKGILNVAGTAAPVAVHGVQHLVHPPIHMAAWPSADRRSRLVFIVDGLAPDSIERSLVAFAQASKQGQGAALDPPKAMPLETILKELDSQGLP